MKKPICIIVIIALVISVILGLISIPKRVEISKGAPAKIIYNYGNKDIEVVLSEEESRTLAGIFRGRAIMLSEIPACLFSENCSIWFGDDYSHGFYPAFDGCAKVYDEQLDEYFSISYFECIRLHKILEKYGFEFPD